MSATADHRTTEPARLLERVYREQVGSITAFFARRYSEPQEVADLTSETFLQAIRSFSTFDPKRGSSRAWLFGIARHVHADYHAKTGSDRRLAERLESQIELSNDEIAELASRIDDQADGRRLLEHCMALPNVERVAIELVDLVGLSTREAAIALDITAGALRVRLFRARARLRKGMS
jgi:RNA polymerase sigma factor (sigma-70 family)